MAANVRAPGGVFEQLVKTAGRPCPRSRAVHHGQWTAGGSGRVRSATPPAVRLRRSRPEHEQAVDRYVELILGQIGPPTVGSGQSWKSTSRNWTTADGCFGTPAGSLFPPSAILGSRRRRAGQKPWRFGDDHCDWNCLETLRFSRPGTNNDNAEDEESTRHGSNRCLPPRAAPCRPTPSRAPQAGSGLRLSSPNRTPIGIGRRMDSGPNNDQRCAFRSAAPSRDHTVGRGASLGWAVVQQQGGPVPRGGADKTRPDEEDGVRASGARIPAYGAPTV
uniref:Transposase n=1 Tax=Globodera pallida TaxID=36090 RepID=A0A183BYK2_GLOPA